MGTTGELIESIEADRTRRCFEIRVNTELLSAFSSREAFISMRDRLAKEFVISVTEVDIRVAIFEASDGQCVSSKTDFPCDIRILADLLKSTMDRHYT